MTPAAPIVDRSHVLAVGAPHSFSRKGHGKSARHCGAPGRRRTPQGHGPRVYRSYERTVLLAGQHDQGDSRGSGSSQAYDAGRSGGWTHPGAESYHQGAARGGGKGKGGG